MTTTAQQKIGEELGRAHATERALVRVLQEQIAMTPRGAYRTALERHLRETRDHAERTSARLHEIGETGSPLGAMGIVAQSAIGQALALAKAPLDLLRGVGGEEKVLENAKDTAAAEAREIASYAALERLADDLGDAKTAKLAREIRADEQRMLDAVVEQIPRLTGNVVSARVRGKPTYESAKTGAGEAVREAAESASERARRTAGAASDAATAAAGGEPWPGYDRQNVGEIRRRLRRAGIDRTRQVAAYERRHKRRTGVLDATQRAEQRAR